MITSSTRLASINHQTDALTELIKAGSMAQHSSWIIGPQLTSNVRLQLARGLSSLREINIFEDDLEKAYETDFTNDGKLMAVASRKGIRLFDNAGSPFGKTMENEQAGMISVDFNSSGGRLASISSDGTLQIWKVKTQEPLLAKPRNISGYVVRFSPNGSLVATGGDDGKVRFFAENGDPTGLKDLRVSNKPLSSINFSHDGSLLATAGTDGFIRLWNVKTGARIHVIPVKAQKDEDRLTRIYSVSFRPDSKTFVTGSSDGAVGLWDTASGKLLATGKPADDSSINQGGNQNGTDTPGHKGTVLSVAFHPSGDLIASGSGDGTFRLWRQKDKELIQEQEFSAYGKRVWDVRFSPDGKRLAASTADGKIRIVDWQGDEYLHRRGHNGPITGLGFSPNGKLLASVSQDMKLRIWNLGGAGARPKDPILLHTGGNPRLSIKPDGMQIATGQRDGSIQLWTSSGEKVGTPLTGHKGQVLDVQFHPNGPILASAGEDGTVLLWDLKTWKSQQLLSPQPGKNEERFNAIAFNPDGSIIAAARNDGSLIVVPVNGKSKPQKVLTSDSDSLSHLQFSPDGKSLYALGNKGFIQRWQVGSWEYLDKIVLEGGDINGFAVSPDSQAIITANVNGSVTLWRPNGEEVSMLDGVDSSGFSPLSVAITRDLSKIAFAGMSGDITFWELELDGLVDRSCELLSDYLSTHPLILKEVEACQSPERLNRGAEALVREGERQVKQKDGLRALQNFQLAKRWNKSKSIDPEVRLAPLLVYSGIRIAELTGDVASTAQQLKKAHDIDPKLNLMPRDKMPKDVTRNIVETDPDKAAIYWATRFFLDNAMNAESSKTAKYFQNIYPFLESIMKLNPTLFTALDWNQICWFGSIKGKAVEVKPACDLAVRMAPPQYIFSYSDTRGLNAAVRGDINRAISDFRAYIGDPNAESKLRTKRADWVRLLKGGTSPKKIFTSQVLKDLEDE